uniref:Uncharacterized protein n=1 Tax=Theileria annulata TaxID=5874 RepID=A0A3B0N7X6_THEAN
MESGQFYNKIIKLINFKKIIIFPIILLIILLIFLLIFLIVRTRRKNVNVLVIGPNNSDSTCRKSIKLFSYILFQIINYVTGSSVTVSGTQKSIYNTNITKVNSNQTSTTGTKDTTGTVGASTVTEEKILNTIAAVTNFGESSTFSKDTNTNITKGISKAPFGAGTVGTTGAFGASTVTALIICNKNDIYNSKNINEIERIIMLELELLSTESNELNKFLSNLTSLKDLEKIGISINLMSYSIKNSNLQEIKEFIMK